MPSSVFRPFYVFGKDLAEKVHNLKTDILKVIFTATVPNVATNTVRDDIAGIPAANGYPANGLTVSLASSGQTDGLYTFSLVDEVFTPAGGAIGSFRYVVLYNDTSATDALIGYWDYGQFVTVGDSEPFTLDFDGTNGVITINVK